MSTPLSTPSPPRLLPSTLVFALTAIFATPSVSDSAAAFQPPRWVPSTAAAAAPAARRCRRTNPILRREIATASLAPDHFSSERGDGVGGTGRSCYVPPYGTVVRASSVVVLGTSSPSASSSSFSRGENPGRRGYGEKEQAKLFDFDHDGYNEPAPRRPTSDYPPNRPRPPTSRMSREFRELDAREEDELRGLRLPDPSPAGEMEHDRQIQGRYPQREDRRGGRSRDVEEDSLADELDIDDDDYEYRSRPPSRPPSPVLAKGGGNYWVNPKAGANGERGQRKGSSSTSSSSRMGVGTLRKDDAPSRGLPSDKKVENGGWWETKREEPSLYVDEEEDYYDDYGVPPPARSRSSFRSGAPPPPRPIKQLYDKLFWFGFDPDVTRPTDRTMFGGTRGKFNAMDLIRDRDERQKGRRLRRRRVPVQQQRIGGEGELDEFGDLFEYEDVSDNGENDYEHNDGDDDYGSLDDEDVYFDDRPPLRNRDPPPPRDYNNPDVAIERDMQFNRSRRSYPHGVDGFSEDNDRDDEYSDDLRRDRGSPPDSRRRRWGGISGEREGRGVPFPGPTSGPHTPERPPRAEAYDRIIGVAPRPADALGDVVDRRRNGYAYKYHDPADDDDLIADYEVVTKRAAVANRTNDEKGGKGPSETTTPAGRRRSWEERALDMDRVPPHGATAWGPQGRLEGNPDAQAEAAARAAEQIMRAKKFLETKNDWVLDAEEEVIALKADATFFETQLTRLSDGPAADDARMDLGCVLGDVEDAARDLRMARLERDDAAVAVQLLEDKHWALFSTREANDAYTFDGGDGKRTKDAVDADVVRHAEAAVDGDDSDSVERRGNEY